MTCPVSIKGAVLRAGRAAGYRPSIAGWYVRTAR